MNGFIDTHAHVAWDIDDGIETKADAKAVLEMMKKDGIEAVIATPHVIPGQTMSKILDQMDQRMNELKELAVEYGIEIYRGCEVFLNFDYLETLDMSLYFSLADSDYVLVEFDVRKDIVENNEAEDMLYEFTIRNKIPVIAHVERYFHHGVDITRVQEWIEMGCKIQINRTSLLGMHGSVSQKNAEKLLDRGLVHVVASDAHRAQGNRICKFTDVYQMISEGYGKQTADILCKSNPKHIINHEELETLNVVEKKSLFKRLWRR